MTHHHISAHEWAYTKTPKGILVEKMVAPPFELYEVKLQFFDRVLRGFFIKETLDGRVFLTFFAVEGRILDARSRSVPSNSAAQAPDTLSEMIKIGKTLADDLDFVRVDFLRGPQKFCIGKMTLFSGSGLARLEPPAFDRTLGAYWTLPDQEKHRINA